jgi:hypothetical protein
MAIANEPAGTPRSERTDNSRLVWALVISLILHLGSYGTYRAGKEFGLWNQLHWPKWLQSIGLLSELFKKKDAQPPKPLQLSEPPLMFVDVTPEAASLEPPKVAKFESDKNSIAANSIASKESDVPEISGKRPNLMKTEDAPRKEFTPLQPSPPANPQPPAKEAQPELKPKPKEAPGDFAMAKPDTNPLKDNGQAEQSRPKTIAEALARQHPESKIPGQKMKQEGGVKRFLEISSVDAKATPFGAYDRALVEAISQRWFALLDQRAYASDGQGKVVLQFILHHDGRVTDMGVAENTAGEVLGLICQKSVLDPAPFASWSGEMRLKFGDSRNIQFTFYYN